MRIVFFGTSDFAVPALKALSLSKHKILGVVTAEDKRRSRGLKLASSPVKIFAQKKNLPILQPADLSNSSLLTFLKNEPADLFVTAAYGKILTKEILQIPKKYAINLHASLLPKYRGAAPINWAIVNGEKQTGVTIFKMNKDMDRGEVILQQKTDISFADTALSLTEKLAKIGAKAIVEVVDLIEQGRATFTAQDEKQVSFAPKLKKEDGLIDWKSSAQQLHNRIRALQPWPGAFTYFEHKLLKIWRSQIIKSEKDAAVGEVVDVDSQRGILVQTGKDKLLLTHLQLAGKKKMSAANFILGHNIIVGKSLGR